MNKWTEAELREIAAADDLHISPFRGDGVTYGTPTWIWSVVVDGSLYVRGYNGKNSRWYQAAATQKAGRVRVAGTERNVAFEPVTNESSDRVDAAYRAKYAKSPHLTPMISGRARAARVRIIPR